VSSTGQRGTAHGGPEIRWFLEAPGSVLPRRSNYYAQASVNVWVAGTQPIASSIGHVQNVLAIQGALFYGTFVLVLVWITTGPIKPEGTACSVFFLTQLKSVVINFTSN
jgi:hypothetical protein